MVMDTHKLLKTAKHLQEPHLKVSYLYFKLPWVVVRERIPIPNDGKHVQTFKKVYDRLYKDFKDKLMQEYALMKTAYLTEYENNY